MRTAAVAMRGANTDPLGRARLKTAALFGVTQGNVCCVMGQRSGYGSERLASSLLKKLCSYSKLQFCWVKRPQCFKLAQIGPNPNLGSSTEPQNRQSTRGGSRGPPTGNPKLFQRLSTGRSSAEATEIGNIMSYESARSVSELRVSEEVHLNVDADCCCLFALRGFVTWHLLAWRRCCYGGRW